MSVAVETVGDGQLEKIGRLALVEDAAPTLSVIVPATDSPGTLTRCLEAIAAAGRPPEQIIVVDRPTAATPTFARNRGAVVATGDVLLFVDSDVEIHPDALDRVRAAFAADPDLTALFGSYDDDPSEADVVSVFRNMLHHHVHQTSAGAMSTFWAGLGAIRREKLFEAGGFADHPIEDIELGMRLAARDELIVLDPLLQGRHLKRWTLSDMVRTDLLVRGAPWVSLFLRHRTSTTLLNLGWRHRLSAASALSVLGSLLVRRPRAAVSGVGGLLALNHAFYRLILRRRGPIHATAGVGLHMIHHLTAVVAVPVGIAAHVREVRRAR